MPPLEAAEAMPQKDRSVPEPLAPCIAAAQSTMSMHAAGTCRLPRPHDFFPFDVFSGRHDLVDHGVDAWLVDELSYVRDHCMVPPYPWGQIIYYNVIMQSIQHLPGDFAELGVGLGGMSIFLSRLAKSYGKKFLAIDSFEGLPPPDFEKENHYFLEGDYRAPKGQNNYEAFLEYRRKFDVEDTLHVIKAFFKDAVIPPEFECFSFVHCDSDLYDSVYDSLEKVWHRIVPGGVIAIDDFFHHAQGPARAVSDFFRKQNEKEQPPLLFVVPTYAVLIVKGTSACMGPKENGQGVPERRAQMYCPRALDGNFYSFELVRRCKPFLACVDRSVEKARAACEVVRKGGHAGQIAAMSRVRANAEAFQAFVCYPDIGSRSGSDIMAYCAPLEDLFDTWQGSLCGMPAEARQQIQITI
eukprot:gnl/TRDRNA2_/TRDRNA2_92109_c0_seq2.p1 gnl/TRDRNA2_/TRDRNA2_92109_c0~~gnl/TRDRNA2_/TRDRNA2_92109_c0_seq2.p1  ORF type:complete len:411 (-),score=81.65 gnl/TRDRNA2_/TRDRNA2_92109_c0_seq2:55-1287(-)